MTEQEKEELRYQNFIKDFISVGELRKMLEPLDDDDMITITRGHACPYHKITHVEDSTSFGFWELRYR